MICCDEKRLRQVLTNLLNNAIKFTQKGHIFLTVHMKYTSDNREQLMFRVADTGIGIKPEDIPKLFTRFTQIEYTYTRKFGGTGLGLAISRTITELLEGEMGVESEFGKGSTFWFTVPTKPKQAENILPPKTSIDEGEKKKLQKPDKLFILLHSGQLAELMQSTFSEDYDINTQVEDTLDTLCDSLQDYTDKFVPQEDQRNPFIAVLIEPTEENTTAVVQRLHAYRSERLDVHIVVVHSFIGPNDDELRKSLDIDLISKPIKISRLHLCLCRADKPLLSPSESRAETIQVETVEELKPCRILIAEDNPVNVRVLLMLLKKLKVTLLDVAKDGQEAVTKFCASKYDLIFMDIQMPIMDGYTATIDIRKWEEEHKAPRVPIIALTANAMEEDKIKCLSVGMDDYIAKPVKLEDLRVKLAERNLM